MKEKEDNWCVVGALFRLDCFVIVRFINTRSWYLDLRNSVAIGWYTSTLEYNLSQEPATIQNSTPQRAHAEQVQIQTE